MAGRLELALLLAALGGDRAARRRILEEGRREAIAEAVAAQAEARARDAKRPPFTTMMKQAGIDPKRDLEGADLRELDLQMEKFYRCDLGGTCLAGVDLRDADLSEANLAHADLTGANLHGADLSRARLAEADLGKANLKHAILAGAVLTGAKLPGAVLTGADFTHAIVTDIEVDPGAEVDAIGLVVPAPGEKARDRRRRKWQDALWTVAVARRLDLLKMEPQDLTLADRALAAERAQRRRSVRTRRSPIDADGGDPEGAVQSWTLGLLRWKRGQTLEAASLLDEALMLARDPALQAEILLARGALAAQGVEHDAAQRIGAAGVAFHALSIAADLERADEAMKLFHRLAALDREDP